MIYCELLGTEVKFGHIHAITLTQSESLLGKRIGYLAASLFLDSEDDESVLVVNSFIRDLSTTNQIEV